MKKRITSVLLALALCLTLLPTAALAADEHTSHCLCGKETHIDKCNGTAVTWEKWTDTAALPSKAGNYYLADDVTLSKEWVPVSGTKLCLNGHTIKYTGNLDRVISLEGSANLTLTDCKNNAGKICGGSYETVNMSTGCGLDMYGGTITDAGSYGGVYVDNGCTFNMYGGVITGNKGNGVHMVAGTFNMSGGTITKNGGGVHVNNDSKFLSTFNVNGAPTITNNGKDGTTTNVYLREGQTIYVTGKFTGEIGVTAADPSAETPIVRPNRIDYNKGTFISDDGKYGIDLEDDSGIVKLKEHNWKYTSDGSTITATCNDCGAKGGTLTLVPPTSLTYDGQEKKADVKPDADWSKNLPEGSGSFEYSPSNIDAGECTATYTYNDGTKTATATVMYTIAKATPKINWNGYPYGKSFTGSAIVPPTASEIQIHDDSNHALDLFDKTSFKWCTADKTPLEGNPIDAGDYIIVATIAATGNTYAVTIEKELTVGQKENLGSYGTKVSVDVPMSPSATEQEFDVYLADELTKQGIHHGGSLEPNTSYNGISFPTSHPYFNSGSWKDGKVIIKTNPTIGMGTGGTIDITANMTSRNYKVIPIQITLTMQPKPTVNDITVTMDGWTYGGTASELQVSGLPTGVELTDSNVTVTYTNTKDGTTSSDRPTDAGDYTVTVSYETDTEIHSSQAVAFTIEPKALTEGDLEFTTESAFTKTYDGDASCNTATVRIKDGVKVKDGDTLPEVSGVYAYNSANVSDANQVTFTSEKRESPNYILPAGLTVTHSASITKADQAALTVTSIDAVYGTDLTLTVTGGTGDGAVTYTVDDGTGAATVSGETLHPVKAGTVTVTATKSGGGNYNDVTSAPAEVTISKADPTVPSNLTGMLNQTLSTVKLPDGWAWDAPNTVMDILGKQAFKASYAESTNYNGKTGADVTVTVTDKEPVEISVTYENKTYDGKAIAPAGALTVTGDKVPVNELEVLYESTDGKGYTSTEAPKNAGTYEVTYKVADSNENYTGSVTRVFTISPKEVTVAPANKTMTKGSAIPTFELTCKDLVAGDTLKPSPTPVFSCFEKNGTTPVSTSTAAGTYTITWTNMDGTTFGNGNYTVTPSATGTLTISNRPSSGGGGGGGGASVPTYPVSSSNASASAVVGGSVSISTKNATAGSTVTVTVSPEAGYRLEKLTVVDKNGKEIPVTLKDGKYTFTMPASQVDIKPVFEKIPAETAEPTFPDVPSSAYYAEPVKWAAEKGITSGTKDGGFAPGNTCTRAQIVTFLWRAAGSPEPQTAETGMTDVSPAAYYAKAVAWAIENGITVGRSDGSFNPNSTCTRANGVTFLYRAAKAAASGNDAGFSDVAADAYYAAAVQWALENGITNGQSNGLFGPNGGCTRAQIVTFLYRMYVKA